MRNKRLLALLLTALMLSAVGCGNGKCHGFRQFAGHFQYAPGPDPVFSEETGIVAFQGKPCRF